MQIKFGSVNAYEQTCLKGPWLPSNNLSEIEECLERTRFLSGHSALVQRLCEDLYLLSW